MNGRFINNTSTEDSSNAIKLDAATKVVIKNCYFHEPVKLKWWQILARLRNWRLKRELQKYGIVGAMNGKVTNISPRKEVKCM